MRRMVLGLFAIAVVACGGSSPAGPSGGGGGGSVTSGATITLTEAGGGNAVITAGQAVTFVNSSSRQISVNSDPHPDHTDCPPINSIGVISPGQTKVSTAFGTVRICRFHDHNNPDDARAKGTIEIR